MLQIFDLNLGLLDVWSVFYFKTAFLELVMKVSRAERVAWQLLSWNRAVLSLWACLPDPTKWVPHCPYILGWEHLQFQKCYVFTLPCVCVHAYVYVHMCKRLWQSGRWVVWSVLSHHQILRVGF